jgi:hypothetical protein
VFVVAVQHIYQLMESPHHLWVGSLLGPALLRPVRRRTGEAILLASRSFINMLVQNLLEDYKV